MRALIFLHFLTFSYLFVVAQNCSNLRNGTYDIEYDSSFRKLPNARFQISNDTCYVTENGIRKYYELVSLYKCRFSLRDTVKIDESKLTNFEKMIRSQKPFYEIYKVDDNSYYFIERIDLHIRASSGKFVRVGM